MSIRTIGIIDNLRDIPAFVASQYETAPAADVMAATGGNTGNVAFVHGVRRILGDRLLRIDWGTHAEAVNRDIDHVVICCAIQLGGHVDLGSWADRLAQIDKPVTLIGLGAQASDTSHFSTVPDGTLRFLERVGSVAHARRPTSVSEANSPPTSSLRPASSQHRSDAPRSMPRRSNTSVAASSPDSPRASSVWPWRRATPGMCRWRRSSERWSKLSCAGRAITCDSIPR